MAWDFATKLCPTKMVPVRFRGQPEEATAAILYGAELGIGPISALQNIFEVHGSPGIYARTAQALLEGKGFQFRTVETSNEVAEVYGWKPGSPVVLDPETHERINPDESSRFTFDEAVTAGWAPEVDESERGGILILGVRYKANTNGKLAGNEKYIRQPRQMLWAKAMMETCRHLSPATLLGIAYSVEELESEQSSPNPIGGSSSGPREEPLTVDEILSANPDPRTTPPSSERPANGLPLTDTLAEREAADAADKARTEGILDAAEDDSDGEGPNLAEAPDDAEAEVVDPEPEAPPLEPVKNKRASKREQSKAAKSAPAKATQGEQIPGKPKGHTDRVEAALAKAQAAQTGGGGEEAPEVPETTPPADPEPQASPGSSEPPISDDPSEDDEAYAAMERAREAELAAQADAEADSAADEDGPVEAGEPSAALAELQQQVAAEEAAKAAPEPVKAPQNWDGAKPATREQLQELAGCIAAAGFKPTAEGKAQWFAWLSQEVERDITANNKLSRSEIDRVIASMKADEQSN
jgi:hypothetical protein